MRQGINLRIFGLSLLAALSAMAMASGAAQASGELSVEGKVLAEGKEAPLVGTLGKSKLLVPGLGLTIECESTSVTGTLMNLTIGGFKHAHGKLQELSKGCKVTGNKFCTIYPSAADRTAKTNAGHITATALVLEGLLSSPTRHFLVASPLTGGGKFTTVYYTVGGGCTLPSETEISGKTASKIASATTEAKEHTLEAITGSEETGLGVGLLYGKEPAFIDEKQGPNHLAGPFEGQNWSIN